MGRTTERLEKKVVRAALHGHRISKSIGVADQTTPLDAACEALEAHRRIKISRRRERRTRGYDTGC